MKNDVNQINKMCRHAYLYNPVISSSIDLLVFSYIFKDDVMKGYLREFIFLIIKEFLIFGRAVFTYPGMPSGKAQLYDPDLLEIIPIPHRRSFIIRERGADISDSVLFLARNTSPYDWLGTSIIDFDNNKIFPFCSDDFNRVYCQAIENQKRL